MRYDKPHLSYGEQLTLMESRGLSVGDWDRAIADLENIGYYPRDLRRIPMLAHCGDLPEPRQSKIYPTLTLLLFLLQGMHPESAWPGSIKVLLESFPDIDGSSLSDYGFPDSWSDVPLWQAIDTIQPSGLEPGT